MWTDSIINSERVMALCPGHVTGLTISGAFAQIWTNFTINGKPRYGALLWSLDRPSYLRCVCLGFSDLDNFCHHW
jgi:hypothetical protein